MRSGEVARVQPGEGSFEEEVAAYERARPSYPDALFDELISYMDEGGATAPYAAVEIGPGTGKATASLLARGFDVSGVEPGANMCGVLRRKYAGRDDFRVIQARFEDAALPGGAFDAVISATSFHWVEPRARLEKAHRMLRRRGTLGVIDTNQIASEADRGFFERCFPIYKRHRPDEVQVAVPAEGDVTPAALQSIESSPLFESVRVLRYRWDQRYPSELYGDLVRSYANSQAMPKAAREALIADLRELIDREFDGYVVRPLVITLLLARRAG